MATAISVDRVGYIIRAIGDGWMPVRIGRRQIGEAS